MIADAQIDSTAENAYPGAPVTARAKFKNGGLRNYVPQTRNNIVPP
jgi:hypothetical protein